MGVTVAPVRIRILTIVDLTEDNDVNLEASFLFYDNLLAKIIINLRLRKTFLDPTVYNNYTRWGQQ